MGWTITTRRRRDRLRHRPHLESLDDRCLLSTGLHGPLPAAITALREHHAGVPVNHAAATHGQGKGTWLVVRHHAASSAHRERPAGTLISSAGAAYDPVIGASNVQSSYGVNGSGMTVAVIDTGIDYNNPGLGGGFGAGSRVVAGYDFSSGSTNPMATTSQHGTGVAGIIGSADPAEPGVAPGVNLVALKVTDASNTGSLDSIARALQWVVDNHARYNITVVNLSLSDGQNYAQNWFATTGGAPEQVTNLIGQLRGMNIPVVVATGNNFDGNQGEGFAAIVQGTISVTATDLSGHLLPNAQRLGSSIGGPSATVIAAPGEGFTTLSGDHGTAGVDGTSFAAPLVSGGIVLLQQIYQQRFGALPSVDQLQQWLQNGSDPINDPATGITIGQLDIPKAAALIPAASPSQSPAPTPAQPITNIQVSTASVAPTPSTPAAQTLTVTTSPSPPPAPANPPAAPTPPPAPPASSPTPPPAPLTSDLQVYSAVVSNAGADGDADASAPTPVSGLARLLSSMKVWSASSASRG
jgi:type VI secretion system secreted protein VgrG